jgi:hypothetical protein
MAIYRELSSFLVSENKIQAKDTIGIDPFLLLYISNILEDNEANLHDSFGVYVFNKLGLHDDINYILIKRDDSYAIFKENDPLSIFTYLFEIKEKYPQTLDSVRLNEYIEKIMKINNRPIIGIPKGKLFFYSALKQ